MSLRCRIYGAALVLTCAALQGQQAPIVQPGAPGHASKVLSPSTAWAAARAPSSADIAFMQGMIHHHQQAVEMVALLRTRGKSKAVQKLGERISISQTDEIRMMRQWLEERKQSVPIEHAHMQHMEHGGRTAIDMSAMAPMPGMLTAAQMTELAAASGSKFDRLFLSGMIQHHTGALIMVQELMDAPASAQDSQLYDFAVDIENTQTAEIHIMKSMLQREKK